MNGALVFQTITCIEYAFEWGIIEIDHHSGSGQLTGLTWGTADLDQAEQWMIVEIVLAK